MADPIYQACCVCGEQTKHSYDYRPLCRDARCREIALGKERAAADTHRYLTEPAPVEPATPRIPWTGANRDPITGAPGRGKQ